MSVSSVPGANPDFFASLLIDSLPIDKVWERVRGVASPVKSPNRIIENLNETESSRHMLAEIYGRFTGGFDTADFEEAGALPDELQLLCTTIS
jgi:hypothetical protein